MYHIIEKVCLSIQGWILIQKSIFLHHPVALFNMPNSNQFAIDIWQNSFIHIDIFKKVYINTDIAIFKISLWIFLSILIFSKNAYWYFVHINILTKSINILSIFQKMPINRQLKSHEICWILFWPNMSWQFFSLWYLENTMMKNQQLYAENSA